MATNEHFIPSGVIYINGRDVGNASDSTISVDEEKKTVPNFRGGGGSAASNSRISAVNFSTTLYNFSAENMALALRADTSAVAATPVADESITSGATLDRLVATAKMIDITVAPVVTSDPAGTTYTVDVDYTVSSAGIFVKAGGAIPVSTALLVSYTPVASTLVQALTQAGSEFEVVIQGLNEETNKPFRFTGFKWKPSPTSGMSLISDDYTSFPVEGEFILDTSKTGAGISQYFTHETS